MLQETMKKITDAESEADEIIRKAKEEADYTVAAAKKAAASSGTAYVAKAEDDEKTSRVGRPAKYTKNNPRATMTLAITSNHRDKIKLYAMQNHTTVSELFMQWIDDNCK